MRTTPGKWRRLRQQGGQIAGHPRVAVVAESETGAIHPVCDMDTGAAPGDVFLIAAAPDLLAALIEAKHRLQDWVGSENSTVQKIGAVIKKATDGA